MSPSFYKVRHLCKFTIIIIFVPKFVDSTEVRDILQRIFRRMESSSDEPPLDFENIWLYNQFDDMMMKICIT